MVDQSSSSDAKSDAPPEHGPSPKTNDEEGFAEGPEGDQPMSFWDHLTELRRRLFFSVVAVFVGCVGTWAFRGQLIELLSEPLKVAWANAGREGTPALQVLAIQSPLMVDVRVVFMAGIFIALPIIFWQVWMFVSPGLYRHEKRFALPFVCCSVMMFLLGAVFAYLYVLPYAMQWLLEYGGAKNYSIQPELGSFIQWTCRVVLAFGAVFEFPLLIAFLAKFGVIRHTSLLRHWRVSVLIISVLSAVLTPPEPVTMGMMAAPMVLLFFISVYVAYLLQPKLDPELEADLADLEDDFEAKPGAKP